MGHGYGFPDMAEIIPECERGSAEVRHVTVSKRDSMMTSLQGGAGYVREGKYAQLLVNGKLVMSDTRHERITNLEVVRRAHGKVLIGGLGLGMIIQPILMKIGVESVTVIEKSKDVCDLMWPHIRRMNRGVEWPASIMVVYDDVFEWKPDSKNDRWNTIYFDIWPDISTDNLPQIAKLHQKYKHYLDRTDPDCWMGSWEQDTLRSQKRKDRTFAY